MAAPHAAVLAAPPRDATGPALLAKAKSKGKSKGKRRTVVADPDRIVGDRPELRQFRIERLENKLRQMEADESFGDEDSRAQIQRELDKLLGVTPGHSRGPTRIPVPRRTMNMGVPRRAARKVEKPNMFRQLIVAGGVIGLIIGIYLKFFVRKRKLSGSPKAPLALNMRQA
jgi:hypothetical protein